LDKPKDILFVLSLIVIPDAGGDWSLQEYGQAVENVDELLDDFHVVATEQGFVVSDEANS
jgi:hypothetical protein